ncbi:MAG: iron-containing alcohol dehydrogenase, partial [Solirubrobacteraceae bacterium]
MQAGGGSAATVLIGFMGSGKSTAARTLARSRGVAALDSDAELERRLGHTIAEEFERAGEAAFREAEERVVLELLARAGEGAVLSLGGGSVLSARVQEALTRHLVVLLDVDPETAWKRASRGGRRPLAREKDAFLALHASREALYERLADAILPGEERDVALRAEAALARLRVAPRGTRLLWASADSGEYPVLLGEGLIHRPAAGGEEQRAGGRPMRGGGMPMRGGGMPPWWPIADERSRAFCVSDEHVAPLYGEGVGETMETIVIAAGESAKTLATAERVWEGLLRAGMTRGDHVVALGGGVVGDLAGFCAATYQRGVPIVQAPTTLVAQVDSAYGGKTGVDLREGKNFVGAYHQPAAVIVDPATLSSLPARELAAGWVEVLKTALIAGGALWERVRGAEPRAACGGEGPGRRGDDAALDEQTILACVRTKLAIVQRDERDDGAR